VNLWFLVAAFSVTHPTTLLRSSTWGCIPGWWWKLRTHAHTRVALLPRLSRPFAPSPRPCPTCGVFGPFHPCVLMCRPLADVGNGDDDPAVTQAQNRAPILQGVTRDFLWRKNNTACCCPRQSWPSPVILLFQVRPAAAQPRALHGR